ncbi:MAG TPA: dehydrogenase [Verrucomicrobiota bacterium]|nr:dehydrogenase [Verrucomicrobiota bacterium]
MKSCVAVILVCLAVAATAETPKHPRFGFPVYTNEPTGKQLAGQHKPADNPALSPSEEQKSFVVPPGFQVRLFASEPEVVNPVAMCWDARGRLWILELYEYPLGARPGTKGRDRVKILEDSDADGQVDKVSVFADGLNLATGLLVANGGVYVGEAPNLWFMEDINGDDVMDRKTPVITGFGLEDRHELLNGFAWGPDGQMYMTHGVFTRTSARDPSNPNAAPVLLTAGLARFEPKTRKFEVFAEGTSNPWGVDFDLKGNAFVSACVIDHLFHLVPGGIYARQAGQPPFSYAYGDLPSIVDHRHHMAAYAGMNIVQGDQWPADWQGAALQGNIHQNALNIDRLTPKGSTFSATKWNDSGDFLTTKDGWFMPVSTQTGPDGAVWVMDWYDRYPCYQNANADPAGVDRERGRIWRIVWTGDDANKPVPSRPTKDMDLEKLSSDELAKLLANPNVWQRRVAQRILTGRGLTAFGPRELDAKTPLHELFKNGTTLESRLAALWTLHSTGLLDDDWLDTAAEDQEPAVRAWAARLTGERGDPTKDAFVRLERLSQDPDLTVRLGVAIAARQFVSSSLTLDTPPKVPISELITGGVLSGLFLNSTRGVDPTFEFLFWMALEPIIAFDPVHAIGFYQQDGAKDTLPFSANVLRKIMHRACDLRDEVMLSRAVLEFGKIPADAAPTLIAGLQGLVDGQRGKVMAPNADAVAVISRLASSANPDVAKTAQQVGSLWGDAASVKADLARLSDANAPLADRLASIQTVRKLKSDESREALLVIATGTDDDSLRVAAVRGLSEIGGDDTAQKLLEKWPKHSPAMQRAVAMLCTTRGNWKWPLYGAIERGEIKRGDLPPSVIRALASSKNEAERRKAQQLFGRVNASPAEKLKLIAEKRKIVVEGPIDLAAGHAVAKRSCLVCHKLYGEGTDIGPDLTGVGRSSLDALLHNVIHPNEIIGEGYENYEIETYDGRLISGRLIENSDARVKLVMAGAGETVLSKSDIKQMHATENSVMPEGLEQLPDADFRNLIWFILAPPQDGKPLDDARKRELMSDSGDQAAAGPARDGESLALWAPDWQVDCPEFEGAPAKFPEFAGRKNVLMTHPVDERTPAAIVRPLVLSPGERATLRFVVAAHEEGDWELRVKADGEVIHRQLVGHDGARWKQVSLDLTPFAGRRIVLRLENAANNWSYEFGYWADLRLDTTNVAAK